MRMCKDYFTVRGIDSLDIQQDKLRLVHFELYTFKTSAQLIVRVIACRRSLNDQLNRTTGRSASWNQPFIYRQIEAVIDFPL